MKQSLGPVLISLCLLACTAPPVTPNPVLGSFADDYGEHYVISLEEWSQLPGSRYHIVKFNEAGRYLIARNDGSNPSDPGKWTRIDWMPLGDMAPYVWAYCYTAYNAPSADSAEATRAADRSTPRTGCNGYPFSRMRALPKDSLLTGSPAH